MFKVVVLLIASLSTFAYAQEIRASAVIIPDSRYRARVHGYLNLVQRHPGGPVHITGRVAGLKRYANHGFHIHESGNLTDGCASTGADYNPDGRSHGASQDEERHAGDLGNLKSNYFGCADVDHVDSYFSLSGPRSVLGRSFVVHEYEDDLGRGGHPLSRKNGNVGDSWSCGVIGLA